MNKLIEKIYEWIKKYDDKNLYEFLNRNLFNFANLEKIAVFLFKIRIRFQSSLSSSYSNVSLIERFAGTRSILRFKNS
jgi:hypothetical protein